MIEQASVFMMCICYYWFIGNQAIHLVIAGYALCLVTTVMAIPLPESPRLLLAYGRVGEMRKAVEWLAWVNRVEIDWGKGFEARVGNYIGQRLRDETVALPQETV